MAAVKIALIGGGSAYSASFLQALIARPQSFQGSQLTLMDVDAEHVALLGCLGRKMARAAGMDLRIEATTDRRAALADAQVVLTSFRVGGLQARAADERIPLRYGIIGQETVGPGGFFFALRTLPVIRALAGELVQAAPDAWWVNYTNPTSIVTEAVSRFTDARIIGICDQAAHDAREALRLAGLPHEGLEFWSAGLNHANWSTRFRLGGRDVMPQLVEAAPRLAHGPDVPPTWRRVFRLVAQYGRLPSSYLPYYYFPEETVAEARASPTTRAQDLLRELPGIFAHYREQAEAPVPHLTHLRGSGAFGDLAVEVIDALANDTGAVYMVNVPGRGALPGFPPGRVVEVPCRVDAWGATPLVQPPLPPGTEGLIQALAEYQALAAEAGWRGTRREAVMALAANPLVRSLPTAEALYDDMARAHQAHLPDRLLAGE